MLKTIETAEKEVISLYLGHVKVEALFKWLVYISLNRRQLAKKLWGVISLGNKPWT